MSTYFLCNTDDPNVVLDDTFKDLFGVISCNQVGDDPSNPTNLFQTFTQEELSQQLVTTDNITDILASIDEFNPLSIATFVSIYLVLFIVGFSTGTVVRIMKKA